MKPTMSRALFGALLFSVAFAAALPAQERLTPEQARGRAESLRAEIAHHDELYFKRSAPEISDAAYDRLKRELAALEREYSALATGDAAPGDDRTGGFPTLRHRTRMLGLAKTYTEAELRAFLAQARRQAGAAAVGFVIEPKFDGLAISVTYERGQLVRAVTRGDGTEGDDVTANFLALCAVPRRLASAVAVPEVIELRGEVFMTYAEFRRINAEAAAAGGEPFAHPRNLAAGTLKQQAAGSPHRQLEVVFYGWGAVEPAALAPASQQDLHRLIRAWGLPGVEDARLGETDDAVWRAVQEFGAKRAKWPFPTDGAVVKVDAVALRSRLGETGDVPRWAVAYKFPPDQAVTRVLGITLQIGRTGALTPVAELEPVKLGGSVIRRVSLHNRDEIARRDIRVGDFVRIEKAGEIIPAVVGVDKDRRPSGAGPFVFPVECPSCRTRLAAEAGVSAVRCPNRACPAQVQRRLEYFASDDCADLAGFGPGVIAKLVDQRLVREPADLFGLEPARLKTTVGEKTAAKLLAAAAQGRAREHWRFVLGLGVAGVGPASAKAVARRFPDLAALSQAATADWLDASGASSRVPGLSDEAARAWAEFLAVPDNRATVERLHAAIHIR
ncbi:MAG: NAD-dependent DNA ligase LigA [Opitutae bacterium]|nr:NAD-dependent DNA ligase LigA [Opitutae bacterium]